MLDQDIKDIIRDTIPDAVIKTKDPRGDGQYIELYIQSQAFKGKSRIAQHQIVYAALEQKIKSDDLQRIALSTSPPEN